MQTVNNLPTLPYFSIGPHVTKPVIWRHVQNNVVNQFVGYFQKSKLLFIINHTNKNESQLSLFTR